MTDEEIIKLLESEDEDGCSNASIQGDEISQNFPIEEPEAYEENREDALTKKQLTQNAIQNDEPVAGPSLAEGFSERRLIAESSSHGSLSRRERGCHHSQYTNVCKLDLSF